MGLIKEPMVYNRNNYDEKYIKIKEKEGHLRESRLWTSLEQRDLNESRWNRSFQPTLWLSSAVEIDSTSTPDESHSVG